MRLGLCCTFHSKPIRFRTTTAKRLSTMPRAEQLAILGDLCMQNADALARALAYCGDHGIGCFRITSGLLPLKTHPDVRYEMDDLPNGDRVVDRFRDCGEFARTHSLRTAFHPDQFILLNSPREDVVASSLRDLAYQAEAAEWVNADVINVHGGGGYGDKPAALKRLTLEISRLSEPIRRRLTLENDDRTYTPEELLPVCLDTGIPLVYDVHHHRCNPDGLTIEQATERALSTWDREPLFHISSPRDGWDARNPRPHHDYIDPADVPDCWRDLQITVEVEAKAKEEAVAALLRLLDA